MYEYLDHTADAGVRATGRDLAEALGESARAMLRLQVPEGTGADPVRSVEIVLESEDEEELVLDWLSALLAQQDVSGLLFTDAAVRSVERTPDGLRLVGDATGSPPGALRGRVESEVKAVTALGLRVTRAAGEVEIRFVVDL